MDDKVRLANNSSACQEICHATQRCVCFSHRKSLGHCWLHLQCQHPEANGRYDSGTAVCCDSSHSLCRLPPATRNYTGGVQIFNYTGGVQTFKVPAGVIALNVTVTGAQGGGANNGFPDALGGTSTGTITVSSGQTFFVYVGGAGAAPGSWTGGPGGWNGGGSSALASFGGGGGGGGSDVRLVKGDLSSRIIVAGGGGGSQQNGCTGGAGGGDVGGDGCHSCLSSTSASRGIGGNQTSGGNPSSPGAGKFGLGGSPPASCAFCTAGGGGWFGGSAATDSSDAGRDCKSGGGGSGFVGRVDNGVMVKSSHTGHGVVTLEPVLPPCKAVCSGTLLRGPVPQFGSLLRRLGQPGDYSACCIGNWAQIGFCDGDGVGGGSGAVQCEGAIAALRLELGYAGPELTCDQIVDHSSGCTVYTLNLVPGGACTDAASALSSAICDAPPPGPPPQAVFRCVDGICTPANSSGVDQTTCDATCGASTKAFRCIGDGVCVLSTNGTASKADCQRICVKPPS